MALSIINPKTKKNLQEAIVDIYLNLKQEATSTDCPKSQKQKADKKPSERAKLLNLDTFLLLDYLQTTIEILINTKKENSEKNDEEANSIGYEQMLQKLEAEIRNHIRVEQQLKLHIEGLNNKLEESQKSASNQIKALQNVNIMIKANIM